MLLKDAEIGKKYIVESVETGTDEMDDFMFSLGCYSGEPITIVAHMSSTFIAVVRDGRYSLDKQLASCVTVK